MKGRIFSDKTEGPTRGETLREDGAPVTGWDKTRGTPTKDTGDWDLERSQYWRYEWDWNPEKMPRVVTEVVRPQ